jgi:hypothetical protein
VINIEDYIRKLEFLKEWMGIVIDNRVGDFIRVSVTMNMFFENGTLVYRPMSMSSDLIVPDFKTFYTSKLNIINK